MQESQLNDYLVVVNTIRGYTETRISPYQYKIIFSYYCSTISTTSISNFKCENGSILYLPV